MKKTIEELMISVCTDLLLEKCRGKDGYVNKEILTESMIDQVMMDVSIGLFQEREMDQSFIKSDLMRRHIVV